MSSFQQKNYISCKHFCGPYQKKSNCLKEAKTFDLVDKDFNFTILNVLKEMKETMYGVKVK